MRSQISHHMPRNSASEARRSWETIADMVRGTADVAGQAGIYVIDERGNQEFRNYTRILESALRAGAALRVEGVEPHDRLMLVMPMGFEFLAAFFGAALIGAAPVPFPPPQDGMRPGDVDPACVSAAQRLNVKAMILAPDLDYSRVPNLTGPNAPEIVTHLGELVADVPVGAAVEPQTSLPEVAYVQFTSGTTGAPRGVELTHENILSNVRAIGHAIEVTPEDVGVSWIPPHNPMGLVGILCFGLYWGIDMVHLDPDRFLKRPEDWLAAISRHRGTLSTAPNFGYHYTVRRCQESNLAGLDLSSWRVAMSGAEPVRAQHMDAFVRRFRDYGVSRDLFLPVYGLAEATLGVTFGELGESFRIDGIYRDRLEKTGDAVPLPQEGPYEAHERLHLVSVGKPLDGVEVQIRDDEGRQLAERKLGEVAVHGPNVMKGYTEDARSTDPRDERCTRLADGWLLTGDLGYLADGYLYLVGRACDLIRRGDGRRVFPEEVELFVNSVDGIRAGSAVVFSGRQPAEPIDSDGTSRWANVVVAYETPAGTEGEEVEAVVRELLDTHFELEPDTVLALPPGSIPKTPSGKVRRFLSQKLFARGKLDRRSRQPDAERTIRIVRRASAEVTRLGRKLWNKLGDFLEH
ncbi:MAG: AMP-binding protein [Myxococcota bacterium]